MTTTDRVRAFNRTWTEVLGLLDRGLVHTGYSLAEARVLFELAHRGSWQRQALRERLDMDASYLTRVLGRLERDGLIVSAPSTKDGRARDLTLTEAGRAAAADLDSRSAAQVDDLLAPLTDDQRRLVAETTSTLTTLFRRRTVTATEPAPSEIRIRDLAPGDLGWVVARHGAIYWDEYGWDADFEALVARIVADFHTGRDGARERAWIAEVDGARAGCIFCCRRDDDTAQLRLLLVEPWARGNRLGTRLVDECLSFAHDAGYARIMLWTNDVLVAARRIYQAAGFTLVEEDKHHSFGHDLIGQTWTLDLSRGDGA